MAAGRALESRWFRRYKTFFIIGVVILSFQVYLAYKFIAIHAKGINNAPQSEYETGRLNNFDVPGENSARRLAEGVNIDDEDNGANSNAINPYSRQKLPPDKPDSFKLSHKNRTLRVEDLDFVPICDVTTKDAVSAIHRAKTQHCKQTIVNITCLIQSERFYPGHLDSYCPNQDLDAGRSLGCFKDDKTYRLLNGYYANYKTNNSPEHCIRMCLQSGFVYAGVQYSTECFCGNDEPPPTARLPDPSCNMKCPANPRKACGGYFTINVYQTGITAFLPQQPERTTLTGTEPIRIAYLLTLNGRAVRQVRRLIRALFNTDHYFYIHVDARQDYLFRELVRLEKRFPNIRLARKRYATIWGGASLLQMLLTSMGVLLETEWKWDYIINLSESDFPVKTSDKLVEFLSANRGKNFVKSHGRETQRFIQRQGLDKTFIECDTHMWRTGDRRLPWGIQIDGGSDWVALSRSFVEYVTVRPPKDNLIEGLLQIFQYTLLPAESFFHTVLRNSIFCNTYIDNNLHVTNWKRKLGCKCQYKHIVDWCGCSPNVFKSDDWQRILATENKQLYFARKFEAVVNQAIILQIEGWLYGPYQLNLTNMNSYWQSVYHHADLSPAPDDAVITVAISIARLVARQLSAQKCSVNVSNLFEVTSYFENDIYKGIIVASNMEMENIGKVRTEVLINNKNKLLISKNNVPLLKRLKSFFVSSDFDQKEQLSRNFGRFLGPFSEPVLIYEFLPGISSSTKACNITVLWIDPSGDVVDASSAQIEVNYVISYLRLTQKAPLLPGSWTVKLVFEKTVLAQSTFLVTPLEFLAKTPITLTQAKITHGGAMKSIVYKWDNFGKPQADRGVLRALVDANSQRVNVELHEWIDSLVDKYYKINDICVKTRRDHSLHDMFKCQYFDLVPCASTNWSTLAPDPKSDIDFIHLSTARANSLVSLR